jgi:hypothetical protein
MRKPTYSSKKARAATGWWKHARPLGKRMSNKSERNGAKRALAVGGLEVQRDITSTD